MIAQKLELRERPCPCCKNDDFENLWSYVHTTTTQTARWVFQVNNVICEKCGFVFTSPVVDPDKLLDYYSDSFSKFTEQALDFNLDKRFNIVNRFRPKNADIFLEVGANRQSEFHVTLKKIFNTVITVEPIVDTVSDYKSMREIPSVKADVLAHYFVLEHIPGIFDFLTDCSNLLKDNGVMICEVPSLELYKNYSSPLILFEHVNHFTPTILARIASQVGFDLLFQSSDDCSRPFGFVAVFQKKVKVKIDLISEYEQNKLFFQEGLMHADLLFNNITLGWLKINELKASNQKIIVWAANETTNRLFSKGSIPDNVIIIDSDPRKRNYFGSESKVFNPSEVENVISTVDHIIICTFLHSEAILKFIKENYNKTFLYENILIIDSI